MKFAFTPAMKKLVREILADLTTPPVLVFPGWDAVADGTRPFHAYCDACIDGFGPAFEQEQTNGSIKPIVYISRATLDSVRHWTTLDLKLAASSGLSRDSAATVAAPSSERSQNTRLWKA